VKVFQLGYLLLAVTGIAAGQGTGNVDRKATEFTLSNGLRVIVLERHQAPIISFQTFVGGGFVNDPAGQTGLARLLGRLAFKGTETTGSRNWSEEKKALDAADEAWARMQSERNKGPRMVPETFDSLRAQWRLAEDAAQRQGNPEEYSRILMENGATGVHLGANWYGLQAAYSLPSNRMEFWFQMEAERLMHPVLRDFEKERAAAVEESAKQQANPQTRVLDTLLASAFTAHPYRVPAVGWPSDLPELSRREGRAFLEERFVPGNIVMALVGDVNPAEAKRLAEKYLGPMPPKPMPPVVRTVEPPQQGPRLVQLDQTGQFLVAIGYKRPSYFDKDDIALDLLRGILAEGTSAIAYRDLVQEKKIAAALQVVSSYPDGHDVSLFVFFLAPAPGQSVDQVQRAVDELLGRIRSQKLPDSVIEQAKAQAQAAAYQRLATNANLAEMLALHAAVYGDWKKLFTLIDDMEKLTADDVLRVAQRYLIPANRTTVFTAYPGMPVRAPRASGGGQ